MHTTVLAWAHSQRPLNIHPSSLSGCNNESRTTNLDLRTSARVTSPPGVAACLPVPPRAFRPAQRSQAASGRFTSDGGPCSLSWIVCFVCFALPCGSGSNVSSLWSTSVQPGFPVRAIQALLVSSRPGRVLTSPSRSCAAPAEGRRDSETYSGLPCGCRSLGPQACRQSHRPSRQPNSATGQATHGKKRRNAIRRLSRPCGPRPGHVVRMGGRC